MKEVAVARNRTATIVLVAVAAECGMSANACLAGSGLTEVALADPAVDIDVGQEMTVIRNLVHHTGNSPGVGAKTGRRVTLGMLGAWGLALQLSRNPRDMTEIAYEYGYRKFSWELMRPGEIREDGLERWNYFDADEIPADIRDFVIERDLAYTATLIPMLLGRNVSFRTETVLDASRGQALSDAFPGHEVRFNCERNAQVLALGVLDVPLPRSEPLAAGMCRRQCDELLGVRIRRPGVAASVRSTLLSLGPRRPSLRELANERHVDPRTLRRQLLADGTSFREIVDEVGRTLATEMLTESGVTVEQVAHRLGYADAASLTRAFKRWTGQTPGSIARGNGAGSVEGESEPLAIS